MLEVRSPSFRIPVWQLLGCLAVGILAVSCASLFIRFAQAESMPTLVIAAWRLTFASIVLVPYAWATRREELRSTAAREYAVLALSGLFLGLHFAAWIGSLAYTSVASSVVLVSMGPVFVAIGSRLFLGERPARRTVCGIGLAGVGSAVIGWGDFGLGWSQLGGDVLALAGAAAVAGYLMIGRRVRARRSLTAYIAPVYASAMIVLLLLVSISGRSMFGYSSAGFGWALALGLVPQLVGHSTLNWALRHLSATFVSLVTLTEPIGAGILAYAFLGEPVTFRTAVGGLFVLVGVYIASRSELSASSDTKAG